MEYTTWVAIKFDKWSGNTNELYEHLAMNGYTYDVSVSNSGTQTLFVAEDEFDYVVTIMNDRDLHYVIQ